MKFSLVMLTRNEIEACRVILPRINPSWVDEVIVVDGNSTDGTAEFAEQFGFKVVHQKSKGIVEGLKEGFEAAQGDVIITFTPDNNMIPEKIPELVAKMKEGYDMVTVSRYYQGAKSEDDHAISGFGNWMFTQLTNVLFGAKYTDVLGFYRAYRKDLVKELGIDVKLSIDTQLCIRCVTTGKKVADIGGDEPPRIGGKSSRSIIKNGAIELHTILSEFADWKKSKWFGKGEHAKLFAAELKRAENEAKRAEALQSGTREKIAKAANRRLAKSAHSARLAKAKKPKVLSSAAAPQQAGAPTSGTNQPEA